MANSFTTRVRYVAAVALLIVLAGSIFRIVADNRAKSGDGRARRVVAIATSHW